MRRADLISGFALLLVLCGGARVALADERPTDARVRDLVIPPDMEVHAFLGALAEATGLPIQWKADDKSVRSNRLVGGITLRGDPQTLLAKARGLLLLQDLVFIPVGSPEEPVYLVADARQSSVLMRLKPEHVVLTEGNLAHYEAQDGLFVTTSIQVQNLKDVRAARAGLQRLVSPQNIGSVTEIPANRCFVVTDFAPVAVAIYRLLTEMDRQDALGPAGQRTEALDVRHGRADDVAAVLRQHFAESADASKPNRPAPDQPAAPEVRISADVRTNRILVSASEGEIRRVREALALLDTPLPDVAYDTVVLRLAHAQASEIAAYLRHLMADAPGPWRTRAGERTGSVVADDRTNSLVVVASQACRAEIEKVVAKLDVPVK
jgi:type II secretory pathway component GspD/PulD (secretin)